MKFFVPFAKDKAQAEQVYNSIKQHLFEELDAEFSDRKIFRLRNYHNGQDLTSEVGEPHPYTHEHVIAILYEPSRHLYHVCTTDRGVVRGTSILVGVDEVISATDFEAEGEGA